MATIKISANALEKGDQVDVLQFINSHVSGFVSAVCAKEDGNIVLVRTEYLNINAIKE